MSPTIFAVQHVLLPTLKQMGIDINIDVIENGYFPDVVGTINANIKSNPQPLAPISLLSRGSNTLQKIVIHVQTTGEMMEKCYTKQFKSKLIKTLEKEG